MYGFNLAPQSSLLAPSAISGPSARYKQLIAEEKERMERWEKKRGGAGERNTPSVEARDEQQYSLCKAPTRRRREAPGTQETRPRGN